MVYSFHDSEHYSYACIYAPWIINNAIYEHVDVLIVAALWGSILTDLKDSGSVHLSCGGGPDPAACFPPPPLPPLLDGLSTARRRGCAQLRSYWGTRERTRGGKADMLYKYTIRFCSCLLHCQVNTLKHQYKCDTCVGSSVWRVTYYWKRVLCWGHIPRDRRMVSMSVRMSLP